MLFLIKGTGLVLALISLINADSDEDCPPELNDLVLEPPELLVEYGSSFSVGCSSTNISDLNWRGHLENMTITRENQTIYWNINNLTDWELQPVCYLNRSGVECSRALKLIMYKFPDLVSISIVNHTGPMTAGGQYDLRCDVQNVAPVHLLTVNWYKDSVLVDTTNFTDINNKLPVNQSSTLQISISKEDQGVRYKCGAILNLGPEGPLSPPPPDTSHPLTINISNSDEDCPPELNDLVLEPPELLVEYGSSISVGCSSTNINDLNWRGHLENMTITRENQTIYWDINNLTDWELQPVCYLNRSGVECSRALKLIMYKIPDLVSISIVNHTGPMTAGGQYDLRCDVQNVAPVHLLTVNWYKGSVLEDTTNFTDINNKLPVNQSSTLQISISKEDQGVQYTCEAILNLGPEGPLPPPNTSHSLTIDISTQSYNCSDLVLDPPELVVRYGAPLSVSCRSLSKYTDLRWKVPQENMFSPVEGNVTWRTDNLTDWEIEPVCYMMLDGVECAKFLPIIIYKAPDQVSISVVNHTGPLIGGRKYDLQCDIQNFAPLQVLSVAWYKGVELLKNRGFSNFSTKTPSNKTVTLKITANKDDHQYSCAAKLKLGLESPPIVKSNLNISVHYKPVINCSSWSPMINTTLKSYPYNVLGNPPPNITWYRDKTLLSLDMRLSRSDSGLYKFVASNVMGETSCVTKITVEYAPIFNCFGTYEGRENDTFKDKCLVMASPEAEITWEKSGKMVNPLHHLTRGESGSYVITAKNTHGTADHSFTVNVLYGPEIKPDGEVVKVKEGSEVSLSCSAEGNPEPVLTWSFQNETKANGTRKTELTISKVFRSHAGEYICTATNQLGSITRNVSLMVESVKPITIQPDKLVVEFGSSASANCSVFTTHLGMGWEASQGAIDMMEDVDFLTWKVESLTHWDIEPWCFYNTDEQWQLALQVTVYKRPDQVSISTVDHTGPMIEGRQYELRCDVQNVAPVRLLKVKWYKGQQLLQTYSFTDETKFPVDKTVRLQVSPRRGDDGVQYRCEAELELGPERPKPSPRVTLDHLNITVHYKPVINCSSWSPMINTTLKSYPYKVLGNPPPNITWYRDETLLSLDMRLNRSDSGQYKFVASNVMGETSCAPKITVEYAPIFNCSRIYEGRENDTFKDKCLVMASPEAEITWEKSGKMVNPLHHLTRGDSGSYVITAKNKHGTAENRFLVNVLYKSVINCSSWSPLINTTLNSYPYNVLANPSPNITWYRDETLLSLDMRLSRSDSGQYKFVASNVMGETSCVTKITVEYAPIFNCSRIYEGRENDTFKDKCLVMASPEAEITWKKSGKIINPLHHLTRGDSGSYDITAVNKHGTAENRFLVNVLYKSVINCSSWSPLINTTLNSYPYNVLANPSPNITWYRDETLLSLDMRLSRSDSGQYKFVASNVMGETSCVTKITVEYAPIFNCSRIYEGRENDTFKDKCLVMASPEAEITWKKSGKIINPLHHLTRGDSGSYDITAVNKHGTAENRFLVNVLYGPEIHLAKRSEEVSVGKDVSLHCNASGNPNPTVKWRFKNQYKTTEAILKISEVKLENAGEYTCIATNILGSRNATISLEVKEHNFRKIVIIVVVIFFFLLIIFLIVYLCIKRKKSGKYNVHTNGITSAITMSLLKPTANS